MNWSRVWRWALEIAASAFIAAGIILCAIGLVWLIAWLMVITG